MLLRIFDGSRGARGHGKDKKTGAFLCAFAFLKLSHDPWAATTVENPKKHLGTCQPKLKKKKKRGLKKRDKTRQTPV